MVDYIYVQTEKLEFDGTITKAGWRIDISLTNSIDFASGIDTVDLSIVQTTDRSLIPVSGKKQDFDFSFELIDDGSNKTYQVDNIGNLVTYGDITTKGQLKFLLEKIMTNSAVARYYIYSEWLDTTYVGFLKINGSATGDEFFNRVTFTANLKSGVNSLSLFAKESV